MLRKQRLLFKLWMEILIDFRKVRKSMQVRVTVRSNDTFRRLLQKTKEIRKKDVLENI